MKVPSPWPELLSLYLDYFPQMIQFLIAVLSHLSYTVSKFHLIYEVISHDPILEMPKTLIKRCMVLIEKLSRFVIELDAIMFQTTALSTEF